MKIEDESNEPSYDRISKGYFNKYWQEYIIVQMSKSRISNYHLLQYEKDRYAFEIRYRSKIQMTRTKTKGTHHYSIIAILQKIYICIVLSGKSVYSITLPDY